MPVSGRLKIIKKHPNGRVEVLFKTVSAKDTPDAVEQLCLNYEHSLKEGMPALYAIACLVLDFLCIHPFRDGNGRVARLLTLLALYQNGFQVGCYISLERIIEGTKEDYYKTLNISSRQWHESRHNVMPWVHYFLATVLTAYKEFSERAGALSVRRGAKTEIVRDVILKQQGDFTMTEVRGACSCIGPDMVRKVFRTLKAEKKIVCLGKGKSAKWRVGK